MLRDAITVETDQFESREAKPHFINPGCFGEDFAVWLQAELTRLSGEFEFSEPVQEDYGWGFWARKGDDSFWFALGIMDDDGRDEPPQWNVSIDYQAGPNLLKRLFHKPDGQAFERLRDAAWQAIRANRWMREIKD